MGPKGWIIDRESGNEFLRQLPDSGGMKLDLLYGRSRVGKIYLLTFAGPGRTFHFTASATTPEQNHRVLIKEALGGRERTTIATTAACNVAVLSRFTSSKVGMSNFAVRTCDGRAIALHLLDHSVQNSSSKGVLLPNMCLSGLDPTFV